MTSRTDPRLALVADAVRAPSSHNTQPWRFRLTGEGIELHADRGRALPVNDPLDRELTISCGAALATLSIAATRHGWEAAVELRPSDDADHLATVRLAPADPVGGPDPWAAIRARATHRTAFLDRPVPDRSIVRAVAAAARPGVWVHVLEEAHRPALAELVAAGDGAQFGDPAWRRELAAWMRPRRRGDGLPVAAGVGAITRAVVSHVDLGARTGNADRALTAAAPAVIVLGTERDDATAWLHAGRSLQHLLLAAAADGVQAGFLDQPCQVDALRARLAALVGRPNPQVVLRLGYPARRRRRRPSARRPLRDVVAVEAGERWAGAIPAG